MKIDKELIQRYHLGLCSAQERAAVEAWLDTEETDMTFLEAQQLQDLEDRGWEKLIERPDLQFKTAAQTKILRLRWQIAASITLLTGIGIACFTFRHPQAHQQLAAKVSFKEVRTKKGEKLQVILPDGTQVWLNSESSLRFPEQFSTSNRTVSFTGEGYFSIAKNPAKPFTVTSERSSIRVLGTRFNLRDYNGETQSTVVVEEGKIRFSGPDTSKNQILTAGQKGTYKPGMPEGLSSQSVYNVSKYLSWKDNKLVMDNLTLQEIGLVLERWYGIRVLITSPELRNKRYTGSFENPAPKQVIESIAFALKCNYNHQQNTWIITK